MRNEKGSKEEQKRNKRNHKDKLKKTNRKAWKREINDEREKQEK